MSRIKRWLAGAASTALLMGLAVPATSYADDAVAPPTNHAGACEVDEGVTMVVDYQKLGGGAEVRCFIGDPADGVEALRGAGFTMESPKPFIDTAVCRINGRPAADETVPLKENPAYTEDCSKFPPANGFWSYWSSDDKGSTWEFSQNGIGGTDPKPGDWEGWSFSLNADLGSNPEPRTDLALAPSLNADSTRMAADWIAGQWDADATHYSAGLADDVLALAAAKAHPEIISEMVESMKTSDVEYYSSGADSLAKMLIALDATGQDTENFLGCDRDLTAELDTYIADDAASLDNYWGPHLVTIALNRLEKEVPQNVWELLIARQQANGGFSGFSSPEPDDTGMGLMALVGVSQNALNPQSMRDAADAAIVKAIAWANNPANQKTQDGNYYWTTYSPANSTGILGGALADAGQDISSPQTFMRAQQKLTGVGAWSNKLNGTRANGMGTTQGIFAVTGTSIAKATLEVPRVTTTCSVKPAFTTQPASTTVTAGGKATFTVAVTGDPTPGITWEQDLKGIWTAIKDVTGATLTLDNVGNDADGLKVRAVAANAAGYAVSDIATLTVKAAVTPPKEYPATVYNTPGYHNVNGREWFTTCEKYSQTQRCTTTIKATTVTWNGARYVVTTDYVFNNLTYLPSPRELWKNNPLGGNGEVGAEVKWTTADGRNWRTVCDTAATGGDGCRTYAMASVIETITTPSKSNQYKWVTKEIFNSMVQFS